ncbi:26301_t:CDS:2 [Dentiscutata erythropus]|uniref:26301_t:CDS:1 n=1 Tax=Dentiscutata erythropus TaxID=1348616 RepID=A0A9N9GC90_9GLOM|nr:26301_t:CDS:2 [Dentiscutata erythropus]
MGRKRKTIASQHKGVKHVLPSIELSEKQTDSSGSLSTPNVSSVSSTSNSSQIESNKQIFQKRLSLTIRTTGFGGHVKNDTKWIEAQRFCRQTRSNIIQRIKDSIYTEFEDLIKPKRENCQVTRDKELRFKNSRIIRECYAKLNRPVNVEDDPNYTYLNFILDHVFPDPKTEKNFIAFGIVVALNYLDLSKEITIVPSEVVQKMNYFLEKMNVPDHENCD